MNFQRLCAAVPDKRASVVFLQQQGILHNPRYCQNGHAMRLQIRDKGDRWRCHIRGCRCEKSIRADTWINPSKLPFQTIILFIYCWSKELTSVRFCQEELEISCDTIVNFNNYLREVCAYSLMQNPPIIGGPGLTVEIDETLYSRRKNHRGRVLPQAWVFGGICRETNESFLFEVPDRTAQTLLPIIQNNIRPGSIIVSDEWRSYLRVGTLPQNYQHLTVNHSQHFVDPITGAHTQKIESTWNRAKSRNKRHCGTNREMIPGYLCEFMWRQRLNGRDPFEVILNDIVAFWPPQL